MEPTYYWDALSPEARRWLTEHTEPGETILFATYPHSWLYLRHVGALPRSAGPDRSRPAEMVRAAKPARCLFAASTGRSPPQGQPAYTVTKLGIPLIWIFPFSEVERLNARSRSAETGTFRSAQCQIPPARPDCSANKTTRMITPDKSMRSCKIEIRVAGFSAEPRPVGKRWDS